MGVTCMRNEMMFVQFLVAWIEIFKSALLKFGDVMLDYVVSVASIFDSTDFDTFSWDPVMELSNFKRETLNAHNNYRTQHGCPPLIMSEELTNTAQAWADKLSDRGILQYSENPSLGENVCVVDLDTSPSQVVKEWYKEIDHYNYNNPGWNKGAYRVSQLLWKSTSEIGVGVAKVPGQNKAYVVVNYRPAGNNNMPGEFERNVLPPQKRNDENANLRKNLMRRQ